MLPALARKAIETYSDPGDLVLDPMCGIGTTLVEAIHLGRRAVGIELEERWAKLAVANIVHAREQGAPGQAGVILGDARALPRLLASKGRDLVGRERRAPSKVALLPYARIDLLLTAPPYAGEVGEVDGRARGTGENLCAQETRNYGADGSNLGHARGQTYLSAMAQIYGACAAVLRPGGFLVVVTKNLRAGGASTTSPARQSTSAAPPASSTGST
jgi:hypothetical protein